MKKFGCFILLLFVSCGEKNEEPPQPIEPYEFVRADTQSCDFTGHVEGVIDEVELQPAFEWADVTRATHLVPFGDDVLVVDSIGLKRLSPSDQSSTLIWEPAPSERIVSIATSGTDLLAVEENALFSVNRYTVDANVLSAPTLMIEVPNVLSIALTVDDDGFLIIAIGETAPEARNSQYARDGTTIEGSVVRLDPDNPTIPIADNPRYSDTPGLVYAIGVREPKGCSVDSESNVWCADQGIEFSEIHRVRRGGNLGWPNFDGTTCALFDGCELELEQLPQARFERQPDCGVIGGFELTSSEFPTLQKTLFFANTCDNRVWAMLLDSPDLYFWDGPSGIVTGTLTGMGYDATGDVFALTDGGIFKIAPTVTDPFPRLISESGCFKEGAQTVGMIPYEINAELWTDGAIKDRWMEIPPGTTIDASDKTSLDFPIGSVLAKNFRFQIGDDVVPFETRVMTRTSFGWEFYTYRWREDGSDADLLFESDDKVFLATVEEQETGVRHLWPDRSQCNICHNSGLLVLGPRLDQMDRTLTHEQTEFDQLELLKSLDYLAVDSVDSVIPDPFDETEPLQKRARAYLHTNCAHCHRPGGWKPRSLTMDLRWDNTFAETNTCGVRAQGGAFITSEPRIKPGDPDGSVLVQRLRDTDLEQMPPLGRSVLQMQGIALIEEWIRTLEACPPSE